ncbi:MAG TPA: zinc ribbon domain-containing protein [Gemmatimonadales bacterium]|jgi:hypothetical protein
MDDVVKLFRFLVMRLNTEDPERLHTPLQISEVYQRVAPYRRFKLELGFDTIDDYDTALLRLLAGEHDLVALEPDDARARLAAELDEVDPDPTTYREFAAARVTLSPQAVRAVLSDRAAYQPLSSPPPDAPAPDRPAVAGPIPAAAAPVESEPALEQPMPEIAADPAPSPVSPFAPVMDVPICPHCAGALPTRRAVSFCPHCGSVLAPARCSVCGDRTDSDWSYCVTCGAPLRR